MKQLLNDWIEELHRKAPDSIGDLIRFEAVCCNPETGEYAFRVDTAQWMQNPYGTLHGGITATIFDQGMGMIGTCLLNREVLTPSVQLSLTYHRPLIPGERILLKVYTVSLSKTLINMRAEAMQWDHPDKLCVSGSSIYYIKYPVL